MSRKHFPLPPSIPAVPGARLPLATKFESRAGGLTKGGLITNGFAEQRKGRFEVLPRPGLDTAYGAGLTDSFLNGQGLLMGSPDGTGTNASNLFIVANGTGTGTYSTIRIVPNKLTFTVQPSDATPGTSISPAVKVAVQNASGVTLAYAADFITVSIEDNPGGSTLSGTTTVRAVSGVATFSDLSLDVTEENYTLRASIPGIYRIRNPFDITARTITIAGGINVNVHTKAVALWGDVDTVPHTYEVTVTADVTSSDAAVAALVWGTGWASGCTFTLIANADITGKGGNGGAGGAAGIDGPAGDGVAGEAGGNAFEKSGNTVTVSGSGTLAGGGGGGGGGGGAPTSDGGGGGGGAGSSVGLGGTSGSAAGSNGTATAGGAGGDDPSNPPGIGKGGDGGNLETAGSNGTSGTPYPPPFGTARPGGAGGAAGQGIVA